MRKIIATVEKDGTTAISNRKGTERPCVIMIPAAFPKRCATTGERKIDEAPAAEPSASIAPIWPSEAAWTSSKKMLKKRTVSPNAVPKIRLRSEEHTSELQSRLHLVCRL